MIPRSETANFSNLSEDLITNFKQLFKFIDIDNDNSISKKDVERLLDVMNLKNSIDPNTMFFKDAATITYPEFLSIMGKLFQGFPGYAELREALASFSEAGDGKELDKIDLEDLFGYLSKAGFGIQDKDSFVSHWKHYVHTEKGKEYFQGDKFLQNFG